MIRSLSSREKMSYARSPRGVSSTTIGTRAIPRLLATLARIPFFVHRSEEHTSELQSLAYLVCRLLLEKKKKIKKYTIIYTLEKISRMFDDAVVRDIIHNVVIGMH